MADNLQDLRQWNNGFPDRNHVQPKEHSRSVDGAFLSGESAVIVSGPPELANGSIITNLVPIGLVQQAQISQNKQLNQIFEIGGRIPFYVPSRVTVNASLSRVIFDGPSLFYALYRSANGDESTVPAYTDFYSGGAIKAANSPTMPYNETGVINRPADSQAQANNDPGLFWSNLASSIFNKPLGLGFILYDMEGQPYGGAYLEKCYVRSHSFGVSANQTVLAENISLAATKLKPISARDIPGPDAI